MRGSKLLQARNQKTSNFFVLSEHCYGNNHMQIYELYELYAEICDFILPIL